MSNLDYYLKKGNREGTDTAARFNDASGDIGYPESYSTQEPQKMITPMSEDEAMLRRNNLYALRDVNPHDLSALITNIRGKGQEDLSPIANVPEQKTEADTTPSDILKLLESFKQNSSSLPERNAFPQTKQKLKRIDLNPDGSHKSFHFDTSGSEE